MRRNRLNIIWMIIVLSFLLSAAAVPAYALAPDTQMPDSSNSLAQPKPLTLSIDSENRYDGMERSYSEGYIPTVSDGYAAVVVPVLCDGSLLNNVLRASVRLGDTGTMPFICKNYEKNIHLQENSVNGGTTEIESYLVSFPLELAVGRINGSYPVAISLTGADTAGNPVNADFTVYVTITDGKDPNAKEDEKTEEPVYPPKILVSSYSCTSDSGEVCAGDRVRLCVTLVNTSKIEAARNMTVTVTPPNENFTLLNASDTQYIEYLGAGASVDIVYDYEISLSALPGQYDFALNYDYFYNKALYDHGAGTAKITVDGKLEMSFDPILIPSEVTVSDTVEAQIQAMNLSRITAYNVRAVIDVDGLRPSGTVFIGDLKGGTSQTASSQITVTALSGADSAYGKTTGTVTYYYEDANGNEYSETKDISLTVKSPFSDKPSEPQDSPSQWWIIMLVIVIVISVAGICLTVMLRRRKNINESDK